MPPDDTAGLSRLLEQPEDCIDLGRAALALARVEYPDLNVSAELARLDELALRAAPRVKADADPAGRVAALRSFLAGECGFRGNEEDYYDPGNSLLNEVLGRRTGIPITLSVVYMEVSRRLGIRLRGVGLPGHFLVRSDDPPLFLDPFHGGRIVTAADCRRMIERMYQGQMEFRAEFLAPVSAKYIVLRMLNNLRGIYLDRQQLPKALAVVEMALEITPDSPDDLKQRGLLHYRLHHNRQARADLESYLFLNPRSADAAEVKRMLQEMKRAAARLN